MEKKNLIIIIYWSQNFFLLDSYSLNQLTNDHTDMKMVLLDSISATDVPFAMPNFEKLVKVGQIGQKLFLTNYWGCHISSMVDLRENF